MARSESLLRNSCLLQERLDDLLAQLRENAADLERIQRAQEESRESK